MQLGQVQLQEARASALQVVPERAPPPTHYPEASHSGTCAQPPPPPTHVHHVPASTSSTGKHPRRGDTTAPTRKFKDARTGSVHTVTKAKHRLARYVPPLFSPSSLQLRSYGW